MAPETVRRAAGTTRWPNAADYHPTFNAAPGAALPVVRLAPEGGGSAEIFTMRWGLVPSYTKKDDRPDFFRMFNARSETVAEKTSFSRLVSSRRCLVLADGFYEWAKEKGGAKQPYYIHLRAANSGAGGSSGGGEGDEDGEPLVMAGLWDVWESPDGPLASYTILTTDASKRLEWLHNRMPVILRTKEAQDLWLNAKGAKGLQNLFVPYNGDDLVWHPVTPAMGKASFQGPECCKELRKLSPADFFKPRSKASGSAAAAAAGTEQQQQQQQQQAAVKPEPGLAAQEPAAATQAEGVVVGHGGRQQQVAQGSQAPEALNADERPAAGPGSPPEQRWVKQSPASGGQKRKVVGGPGGTSRGGKIPGGKSPGGSSKKKMKGEPPAGQPSIAKFFSKAQ